MTLDKAWAIRDWLGMVSLVFIVLFLTNALIRIIDHQATTGHIKNALADALGYLPVLNIRDVVLDESRDGNGWLSLAIIDAPREPQPRDLRVMENQLESRLGKPVNLIVRTHITKGVSSTGESLVHFYRTADGLEHMTVPHSDTQTLNVVTQLLRERVETLPNVVLSGVELRKEGDGVRTVHATLQGSVRPFPGGSAVMEKEIRQRLHDPNIRLVTHFIKSETFEAGTAISSEVVPDVNAPEALLLEAAAGEKIQVKTGLFSNSIKAHFRNRQWTVFADVSGRRLITPEEVREIEDELRKEVDDELNFQVFSKVEAMVDATALRRFGGREGRTQGSAAQPEGRCRGCGHVRCTGCQPGHRVHRILHRSPIRRADRTDRGGGRPALSAVSVPGSTAVPRSGPGHGPGDGPGRDLHAQAPDLCPLGTL